jgi:hypothetical protein
VPCPGSLLSTKAIRHRQPQAGALPGGLGREKRLEGALHHLGRHAAAGVGHLDQHVLAARHLVRQDRGQAGVGGADGQHAGAVHGIARIDGQVQQYIVELVGIDQGTPQSVLDIGGDLGARAEHAPHHVVHLVQQVAGVDDHCLQRLAPGKRQQVRGQLGAAPDAGQRHLDPGPGRRKFNRAAPPRPSWRYSPNHSTRRSDAWRLMSSVM